MSFSNPWGFLAVIPVALLLWYAYTRHTKQAYLFSDERMLALPPRWVYAVMYGGFACLGAALVLSIIAFARPLGQMEETETHEFMHRGCLVIDMSSSMQEQDAVQKEYTKMMLVVQAGKEFIAKRKGDAMCIIPFESTVRLELGMPLTTDVAALTQALDELAEKVGGGTAMGDGMFYAFALLAGDMLTKNEQLDLPRLMKEIMDWRQDAGGNDYPYLKNLSARVGKMEDMFMVVLTDGEYNSGSADPLKFLEATERFGIRVYVVGVGFDYGKYPRLTDLVKKTGGQVFLARVPSDTAMLLQEIHMLQKRRVLAEVIKRRRELAPGIMTGASIVLVLAVAIWVGLRIALSVVAQVRARIDALKMLFTKKDSREVTK